jgi:hypothetical protein
MCASHQDTIRLTVGSNIIYFDTGTHGDKRVQTEAAASKTLTVFPSAHALASHLLNFGSH